jgi:hypothetical protein
MSDTDIAYTRDQVYAALKRGYDLVDAIADSTELAEFYQAALAGLPDGPELTPADVGAVLNRVAGELTDHSYETSDTIWTDDVINLAVNAVGHVLEHPGASLYDVIIAAHADTELAVDAWDDLPEGAPEPAKGSPEYNEALYKTVTGWIA